MKTKYIDPQSAKAVASLFEATFSAAEGASEGELIGKLAYELALGINGQDIICLGEFDGEELLAVIFFTRLTFDEAIDVYMLAPVAVHTAHQKKGIGSKLITFGLAELKAKGVAVAVTYGDPAYYSKLGFEALSEQKIAAPLTLSMPSGWLGQALNAPDIPRLRSKPNCVEPFNKAVYW